MRGAPLDEPPGNPGAEGRWTLSTESGYAEYVPAGELTAAAIASASAVASLLVLAAEGVGYGALVVAAVAIRTGECFHTAALMPLVADLAPPRLRGRYMATMVLSFWIGLALAPTLGTQLLSVSAALTFATCAVAAAVASAGILMLEQRLPDESRITPRPGGVAREPLSDPA